jgi:hypothetical protein
LIILSESPRQRSKLLRHPVNAGLDLETDIRKQVFGAAHIPLLARMAKIFSAG